MQIPHTIYLFPFIFFVVLSCIWCLYNDMMMVRRIISKLSRENDLVKEIRACLGIVINAIRVACEIRKNKCPAADKIFFWSRRWWWRWCHDFHSNWVSSFLLPSVGSVLVHAAHCSDLLLFFYHYLCSDYIHIVPVLIANLKRNFFLESNPFRYFILL